MLETRNCPVDCIYTWGEWGICGSTGFGVHNRTVIIGTDCYKTNPINCPSGHMGSGATCPPPEQKICMVDCESTHDPWTTCIKDTGKQSRGVTVTLPQILPGKPCLLDEERPCKVDCEIVWNKWKCENTDPTNCSPITVTTGCDDVTGLPNGCTSCDKVTGKQNRDWGTPIGTPLVTPKPGWDGSGQTWLGYPNPECPMYEEQPCRVDCEGAWGDWSACQSPTGKKKKCSDDALGCSLSFFLISILFQNSHFYFHFFSSIFYYSLSISLF